MKKSLKLNILLLCMCIIPMVLLLHFFRNMPLYFKVFWPKELYGYIDRSGKFVIPPQFDKAYDFENGRADIQYFSDKGYSGAGVDKGEIDHSGKLISPLIFVNYSERPDVNTYRTIGHPDKNGPFLELDRAKNAVGYVDKYGNWVILPKYDDAYSFSKGTAWVEERTGSSGEIRVALIDPKGNYLLPPKCIYAGKFSEGLARCKVTVWFGLFY